MKYKNIYGRRKNFEPLDKRNYTIKTEEQLRAEMDGNHPINKDSQGSYVEPNIIHRSLDEDEIREEFLRSKNATDLIINDGSTSTIRVNFRTSFPFDGEVNEAFIKFTLKGDKVQNTMKRLMVRYDLLMQKAKNHDHNIIIQLSEILISFGVNKLFRFEYLSKKELYDIIQESPIQTDVKVFLARYIGDLNELDYLKLIESVENYINR